MLWKSDFFLRVQRILTAPPPVQEDHRALQKNAAIPYCNSLATILPNVAPFEHLQEDIIDGVYRVVLYRHAACRCKACDCLVQQPGEGEILGSRIGPGIRSKAIYLRNVIGISYRKVPRAMEELFGIIFTPAALIGFETVLAELAQPVEADIVKKIASSDGAIRSWLQVLPSSSCGCLERVRNDWRR